MKMLGLTILSAMALMTIGSGSAAATTFEVEGVTQSQVVTIDASLEPESMTSFQSVLLPKLINKCTASNITGNTISPLTGTIVTGTLSALSFENCTYPVVVDNVGRFYTEHIPGTTNGTLFSELAEITVGIGGANFVGCKTGAGTHIGVITGTASGKATIDINAALSCSFGTFLWQGSYLVTSLTGLGVVA